VLRVGGRLKDSVLDYSTKHPVLLHRDHPLTALVVKHYHTQTQHQGRHLTTGALRAAGFFVEKGAKFLRKVISDCVTCRKLRGSPSQQMMAPLPPCRLESVSPFYNTGIDTFGPYELSNRRCTRQSRGTVKIWGLIFTCMASRAIHVEPLHGLDVSSLANALRRFVAIRGDCNCFYCDRGTNFVGFSKQGEQLVSLKELHSSLDFTGVQWHFNPPHASHFGGAWERKIGALKKVFDGSMSQLKGRTLNIDEFTTLLLEAMSIVNSTPMWEVSSDPKDPLPVSPAMLLTLKGQPDKSVPQTFTDRDVLAYGAKRWRRVQFIADSFWQKWRTFYLSELRERRKWNRVHRNLQSGDVVLLASKGEKRNTWPIAVVVGTKTSSDGLVRSVTVAVVQSDSSRRTYERPISEIVLLIPIEHRDSSSPGNGGLVVRSSGGD